MDDPEIRNGHRRGCGGYCKEFQVPHLRVRCDRPIPTIREHGKPRPFSRDVAQNPRGLPQTLGGRDRANLTWTVMIQSRREYFHLHSYAEEEVRNKPDKEGLAEFHNNTAKALDCWNAQKCFKADLGRL